MLGTEFVREVFAVVSGGGVVAYVTESDRFADLDEGGRSVTIAKVFEIDVVAEVTEVN